jgi:hypothetical protein
LKQGEVQKERGSVYWNYSCGFVDHLGSSQSSIHESTRNKGSSDPEIRLFESSALIPVQLAVADATLMSAAFAL